MWNTGQSRHDDGQKRRGRSVLSIVCVSVCGWIDKPVEFQFWGEVAGQIVQISREEFDTIATCVLSSFSKPFVPRSRNSLPRPATQSYS